MSRGRGLLKKGASKEMRVLSCCERGGRGRRLLYRWVDENDD